MPVHDPAACRIPYPSGCLNAIFVARHKRFTVECRVDGPDGMQTVLAHTNNTGAMSGLLRPGSRALLSPASNPARKLKWTLEALAFHDTLVGVNTLTPNRMLKRAWETGAIPELRGYATFQPEAKIGDSRLDAHLTSDGPDLWVECKNVTLVEDDVARFPDAVTVRGQKHLHELMTLARTGARVALFLLIQRNDAHCFGPADFVDEEYARLFYEALNTGVEAWPFVAEITDSGIALGQRLDVVKE
ncbi:DNA/RNA nuclease SfsA [Pseudodesulfovibrio tunisiensis]|uniref:DNA/RNA nuclease SfsA n=1 Tax=Pseudodesulfovibrio tunisiensis TaxID=463192 RepID=UPI001FB26D04|nr:DNA/RNA nuclease SfsA [Pseudodesulfovibrio tunisiensis]